MKNSPLALFLIATFPLCAMEGKDNSQSPSPKAALPCSDLGFSLDLDFLWWQPSENTQGFGKVVTQENVLNVAINTSGFPRGHNAPLKFDWSPGARLRLGWDTEYENWDLLLDWTWYSNYTKNHINSPVDSATSTNTGLAGSENGLGIYGTWMGDWVPASASIDLSQVPIELVQPGPFRSSKASWKLNYNLWNLEFGRSFLSKGNLLRPFFGLEAGLIDRRVSARYFQYKNLGSLLPFVPNYIGFVDGAYRGKMKYWGLGPRFGILDRFLLPRDFRLSGQFSAALLYGSVSGSDRIVLRNLENGVPSLFGGRKFTDGQVWMPATHLGMALGLGWGTCFGHETRHFSFDVSWEENIWFFHGFSNSVNRGTAQINLNGLTASMQFDF